MTSSWASTTVKKNPSDSIGLTIAIWRQSHNCKYILSVIDYKMYKVSIGSIISYIVKKGNKQQNRWHCILFLRSVLTGWNNFVCTIMQQVTTIGIKWTSSTIFSTTYPIQWQKFSYFQFNYSNGVNYIWSKTNIWNANYARATAFIFATWTDVFVKVSKLLRQKMSRPEGDSNPQPWKSCRML